MKFSSLIFEMIPAPCLLAIRERPEKKKEKENPRIASPNRESRKEEVTGTKWRESREK
jgi:hypothetical protein